MAKLLVDKYHANVRAVDEVYSTAFNITLVLISLYLPLSVQQGRAVLGCNGMQFRSSKMAHQHPPL